MATSDDAKNRAQIAQMAPAAALKSVPGNPQRDGADTGALSRLPAAAHFGAPDRAPPARPLEALPNALRFGSLAPDARNEHGLRFGGGERLQAAQQQALALPPVPTWGQSLLGLLGSEQLQQQRGIAPAQPQGAPAHPTVAAQPASTPSTPSLTQDPTRWGKTAYGNAVGRRGAQGYEFSNQAEDITAAKGNQFTGRDGTAGRISSKGSLMQMPSEAMWRTLGGSQHTQNTQNTQNTPDSGATASGRMRLPDSLQDIRSSGVTVVGGEDTALRNAALQTRGRGEELLRAARNSNRRSEYRQLTQAGTQMLERAGGIDAQRATAPGQRALQQDDSARQWAEGAGRRQREGLENQALSAQLAQQQQTQQRLQQLQQMLADPRTPPEQRQAALQGLQLMQPFNKDQYMRLSGGEDASGAKQGDYVLDLRSGQRVGGGRGALAQVADGWHQLPDGREVFKRGDKVEELRP